jgi:hypothetical protein
VYVLWWWWWWWWWWEWVDCMWIRFLEVAIDDMYICIDAAWRQECVCCVDFDKAYYMWSTIHIVAQSPILNQMVTSNINLDATIQASFSGSGGWRALPTGAGGQRGSWVAGALGIHVAGCVAAFLVL